MNDNRNDKSVRIDYEIWEEVDKQKKRERGQDVTAEGRLIGHKHIIAKAVREYVERHGPGKEVGK